MNDKVVQHFTPLNQAHLVIMSKFSIYIAIIGAICFPSVLASILTEEELAELKQAPFVPGVIKEKGGAPGRAASRGVVAFKEKCQCHGKVCGCCTDIEVSFFEVTGCMNITIIPEEKAFEVSIRVASKDVFKHKISAHQLQKVCATTKKLEDTEICLYTTLDEENANELISCMALDLVFLEIQVLNLNFQCLKYANRELTFIENKITHKQEALANFQVKSPIDLLVKLLKGLIKKIEIQ